MQNSELFRRGFVVALNSKSEQDLINNNVGINTDVKFCEIPDEGTFESLYNKGLFDIMNNVTGSMIDDYEEEMIEYYKINALFDVINNFKKQVSLNNSELNVLGGLEDLLTIAKNGKHSIFFIF